MAFRRKLNNFLPLQTRFFDEYSGCLSIDMWPVWFWQQTVPTFQLGEQDATLPLIEGNRNDRICFAIWKRQENKLDQAIYEKGDWFYWRNKNKPFFLYFCTHSMPHVTLAYQKQFKGKSVQGLMCDVMMEIDCRLVSYEFPHNWIILKKTSWHLLQVDNAMALISVIMLAASEAWREGKQTNSFEGGQRSTCNSTLA